MQVVAKVTEGALKQGTPTVLERFRFCGQARNVNLFLRAVLATYLRRRWDRSLESLEQLGPVVDRNLVLLRESKREMVSGYAERAALLKQFSFTDGDRFFVYSSSVPDELAPAEEAGRDDAGLFTLVSGMQCFRGEGDDLILEDIRQVDFRAAHSDSVMDQYISSRAVKALYWQQELQEIVNILEQSTR